LIEVDGHILWPPKVIECESDHEAIRQAQKLKDGKALEIWLEAKLIAKLD
jgi:hypothetical protein